jgi:hypothetical protein
MPAIDVRKLAEDPWEFRVLINEDDEVVGEYMVDMSEEEYARYGDDVEPHELIEATFQFLLAHEEPEMILTQFDLAEVEKHYPEYPDEVHNYL